LRRSSTFVVGFGIAFGDGGNGFVGGSGFFPSIDQLVTVGESPFSWFGQIPAAAGYLFEGVFCAVSLAIVWGAMAERTKLWVYFAFGAFFTIVYSVVSHWIWSPDGWLFSKGMQDFAGSTGRPLPGRPRRARRRAPARPADRKFGSDGRPNAIPGHNMAVHDARSDHPLVRLVRLQPGLDAVGRLRRRRLLRLRRAEHEPRRPAAGRHRARAHRRGSSSRSPTSR
jgi:hypothetical protein